MAQRNAAQRWPRQSARQCVMIARRASPASQLTSRQDDARMSVACILLARAHTQVDSAKWPHTCAQCHNTTQHICAAPNDTQTRNLPPARRLIITCARASKHSFAQNMQADMIVVVVVAADLRLRLQLAPWERIHWPPVARAPDDRSSCVCGENRARSPQLGVLTTTSVHKLFACLGGAVVVVVVGDEAKVSRSRAQLCASERAMTLLTAAASHGKSQSACVHQIRS